MQCTCIKHRSLLSVYVRTDIPVVCLTQVHLCVPGLLVHTVSERWLISTRDSWRTTQPLLRELSFTYCVGKIELGVLSWMQALVPKEFAISKDRKKRHVYMITWKT